MLVGQRDWWQDFIEVCDIDHSNCNDNDSCNIDERDKWQDFIEVTFYDKNVDNTYYYRININDINCNDDSDSSGDSNDNSWNNVIKYYLYKIASRLERWKVTIWYCILKLERHSLIWYVG